MSKLLENAKRREKVIKALKKYGFFISACSYVIGMLWMFILPHHEFSARNYFSENQLLPGLVDTYFSLNHYAHRTFNDISQSCSDDEMKVREKIKSEFETFGFDVYEQKFSIPSKFINASNVYGVLRSPRASGVESIILNVPFHKNCESAGSLAAMLAIANYFREQTYWAKDIIFLVTEHGLYGAQAWLNGYFHDNTPGIHAEHLYGHGGSIQAAITLDFPGNTINKIDVLYVGSNGLLPNLDLIHVVTRISNMEGVPAKLKHQSQVYLRKSEYLRNLETLIRMMSHQASGYPSGNHGLFYKYRIEALTLHGGDADHSNDHRKEVDFEMIGRMMEGIFRSINNMLEHFHQSFFLYVLPNTHTYISIGMYMPPLGCLVLPLIIYLITLWVDIFHLDREDSEQRNDIMVTMSPLLDVSVIQRYAVSYIMVVSCYFGLIEYFNNINYSHSDDQLFLLLLVSCFGPVIAVLMIQSVSKDTSMNNHRFFALLHLGVLIIVVSIFNFSAAFVIAAFHVPLAFTVAVSGGRLSKLLRTIFSVLSSPPVLIMITIIGSEISLEDNFKSTSFNEILVKWGKAVRYAHLDSELCIWTKDIYYFALFPVWIILSSL